MQYLDRTVMTGCSQTRCHDDVIKWKHFPRYWPFVRGIHRSPVNSPHKCQWRSALMFSLICVWINGWVDNREAGDLRRYSAPYDVIVMVNSLITCLWWSPRPTVANSCTNQCEWHRLRMEAIFSLKIWGSYRVFLYAEPERFDTMIICESMRIRHESNTNWYDAERCNTIHHDGDTVQCEAVPWWWRINTIALWCDENTIGTNRNSHEPMRTCAIQYDNAIVAHRIATYWVTADRRRIPVRMYNESIRMYNDEIRTNRNWHELIRRSAMQSDAIQIGFDS